MKQIFQNLSSGKVEVVEVPCPQAGHGQMLIHTCISLISSGTERMLVEFSQANLIQKARQQPDKVRMVLEKIRTDGPLPALDAVRAKIDQPLPMGYCNVGRILEGDTSVGFAPGDRVASNGPHAEVVCVPKNLCAKVPNGVSDEEAAFTVLGAIALQGIRLAAPTLGETFVVMGLGLVGLITVQLLKANGCRVLGIDLDPRKCEIAWGFGAETVDVSKGEDPLSTAERFSRSQGVDAVLITASTKSNEPIRQAARMCRKRARIILVGVTGLELSRADFFEKELSFQVSCSYGPGRYDPDYEEKGHDYPIGFVRWTEQRNFEAVLDMMADGRLNVTPLISHRFKFENAPDAYKVLVDDRSALGMLLEYPQLGEDELKQRTVQLTKPSGVTPPDEVIVGVIGAGNYATRTLIPAFKAAGVVLKSVSSSGGTSGTYAGQKHGFEETTTDTEKLIAEKSVNTLIIATRHNSHARLTIDAIKKGKHVFVEKPLAIAQEDLDKIEAHYIKLVEQAKAPLFMVGFNRRFSPHIQKIQELLKGITEPMSLIMTVNAGAIPADHWTQDPQVGGGRIIGEACHFVDLLRFLTGSTITSGDIKMMDSQCKDTASIQLGFVDGSLGVIHYFANGSKSFSKERLEIFSGGRILQLDNFRRLRGFGWPGFRKMKLFRQDKGQKACVAAFVKAIRDGEPSPIPFDEIMEVSRVTLQLARKVRS